MDGDGTDNSASYSGAAYVFTRAGGVWSQQTYLKASNTEAGDDRFGRSVAVSGNTLVVGAWGEDSNATGVDGNQADNSATNSSAAYVFSSPAANPAAKDITAFSFASPAATGAISGTNIAVTVPYGTDVTNLVASFTTTGASVSVGATAQVSGATANDFTNPVTYTVTATDSSTQDYTVTVTIAPAAPVVNTPVDGSLTNDSTPAISGAAPANSTVNVYIDNTLVDSVSANASGDWSYTPVVALIEGAHTVKATATVGEITSVDSNTNTFTVDTVAPNATITKKSVGAITSLRNATFSFISNEAGMFECSLDGRKFAACVSPVTTPLLSFGRHTFQVRAVDAAGNVDASPALFIWNVCREWLNNRGFNVYDTPSGKIPSYWLAQGFGPLDGKSSINRYEGVASLHIVGSGATKILRQVINAGGPTGSPIHFEFWVRGSAVPAAGLCRGQVELYNKTTLVQTKFINCPTNTFAYTNLVFNFNASAGFTRMIVKFIYGKASGNAWFDMASLLK